MQRVKPDVKHIAIQDFPRTPWAVSFALRPALAKAFNYCRQYPDKMESLKAVLVFMMKRIGEWESAAKTMQFEGGSQCKPLQSATFVTPALMTDKAGDLKPFNQPVLAHSDEIERNKQAPVLSEHIPNNGAWVTEHATVQRPAQTNPLKRPAMPAQQAAQLEQTVGQEYQPSLADVLAQNAQR